MDSKELEQKARRERDGAIRTAHEINDELSPGQIIDRFYFHGEDRNFTTFVSRFKEDPVPGALMGAAMAWTAGQDYAESQGVRVSDEKDFVSAKLREGKESLTSTGEKLSTKAGEVKGQASHAGSEAKTQAINAFRSEPLINVAVGFSLGAALGSMIPLTEQEDRYLEGAAESLGEGMDQVVQQAKTQAGDIAKNVGQSVSDSFTSH